MTHFPHFQFGGTPQERGLAYGEALRERIQTTYSLYADRLYSQNGFDANQLETRAAKLTRLISAFDDNYTTELNAVAAGAGMPQWQIIALNSRTEILNTPQAECTTLYFEESAVLGQNWDWVAALEELAVLVTWELPNERKVLTFTEPGMLGKIGFNNRGIGVCLNILFARHALNGVPVHILTRALLDCGSVDEARAMLQRSGFGKSSHFLIGDANGNSCSIEFTGGQSFEVQAANGVQLHTNHCIAPAAHKKTALIPTTLERLDQGRAWLEQTAARDIETMKTILLDDSQGASSINGSYHAEALLDGQDVGTCASIVMDLAARRMQIKKGPGAKGQFLSIGL
jgi:isopenicillin-N N-acyltransferase-like protein